MPHQQVVVGSIHLNTESSKSKGLLPDSNHSSAQEVEVPQQNIDVQDTISLDLQWNCNESERLLPDSDHSSAQKVEVPQQNIAVQGTVSQGIQPKLEWIWGTITRWYAWS